MERHDLRQGDCIEGMKSLEAGTVDLVFADPPFNIGYDYDAYDDRRTDKAYLEWTECWGTEVSRILKKSGTFWLAIGDDFAADLKILFQRKLGFSCRSWVIWYYTFGVHCTHKFSRSHTHLFHFVKDPKDFTFNGDIVRVPSARQLVYADSRANSKGRVPDDTWILRPQDLVDGFQPDEDTWYLPRVCGTFKERAGFHGCQMPERLLERIIRVSSKPGQLVVDPFAGSGSTLVVAKKLGRDCLGFEVSANYAARIRNRLEQTYEGQPLEGAKEPKLSAPKTAEGKQLPTAPRFDWSAGKPERSKIAGGIMEAFIVARDGFPVDRVIADPDLNREFVSVCHRFGLPGDACEWNRRLMNLRKSSHFRGLPRSKRTTFSLKETDRYSFACEIAVQHFHSLGHSLDYLLCDPNLADEFDKYVRKIVNQNLPTLLVRWIALSIRKRAKAVRRISQTVVNAVRLPNRKEMVTQLDHERVPACPGLYWLEDADNSKKLYVGQTLNLNDRLHDQLRSTEFNFWGSPREQLLLRYCAVGADDKQEQRRLPGNQSIWIAKWRPLGNYEKLAAL